MLMLQRVSLAAFLLTSVLFADANLTIKSIVFEGNEKIKTATLKKLTQSDEAGIITLAIHKR